LAITITRITETTPITTKVIITSNNITITAIITNSLTTKATTTSNSIITTSNNITITRITAVITRAIITSKTTITIRTIRISPTTITEQIMERNQETDKIKKELTQPG
jgi:hypothetical protein